LAILSIVVATSMMIGQGQVGGHKIRKGMLDGKMMEYADGLVSVKLKGSATRGELRDQAKDVTCPLMVCQPEVG
jgi:hypothetical protein